MNKINRDKFPPDDSYVIGPNKGRQKWRVIENTLLIAYKTNSIPFTNGTYGFPVHPSAQTWKRELVSIQGRKCCYCEKPINRGDLEHYRPKKGYQQISGDPIQRPGYYWLAYRWDNLLLSCKECNESTTKGNKFPILGIRATTPTCNLNDEIAQLLNPYNEDPNDSISFYKHDPISHNARGRATIDTLDLKDRGDLQPIRKDRLNLYVNTLELIKLVDAGTITINQAFAKEARVLLKKAVKDKSPFSGMIMENIKNKHI